MGLGEGLWYDEIVTLVRYARSPLQEILTTFTSQNQHMLYSALARVSTEAFGESIWALRLPAAIMGVASIGALAWFGTMVAPRREALGAAALLAVSYHHVWFSQNARGYTGLMLATLLGSGFLLRMLRAPALSWKPIAGYAVTMALAIMLHLTAGLIVAAHVILWAMLIASKPRFRTSSAVRSPALAFALCSALALVIHLPVLDQLTATLFSASGSAAHLPWTRPSWFAGEMLRGLVRGLPGGWVTLIAGTALTLAGLSSYVRRSPVAAGLMLLPMAVTAAVVIAVGHNLWPRFFFFGFGFAALIMVRGLFVSAERLWPSRSPDLATVAVLLGIAASLATVPRAWAPKQDFDGARRFVEQARSPGDVVVTVDMTQIPYREYLGLDWLAVADSSRLAAVATAHAATWVLVTFPPRLASLSPALWNYLQNEFTRVASFRGTLGGGDVIVLKRQ